jgi:hypothetical protein
MNAKRENYMQGSVPIEDKELKRLLIVNTKFIEKIDQALKYSGGTMQATTQVDQILMKMKLESTRHDLLTYNRNL